MYLIGQEILLMSHSRDIFFKEIFNFLCLNFFVSTGRLEVIWLVGLWCLMPL